MHLQSCFCKCTFKSVAIQGRFNKSWFLNSMTATAIWPIWVRVGPMLGSIWIIWSVTAKTRPGWKLVMEVCPVETLNAVQSGLCFLCCGFMGLFLISSALTFGECCARDFYKGLKAAFCFFGRLFRRLLRR